MNHMNPEQQSPEPNQGPSSGAELASELQKISIDAERADQAKALLASATEAANSITMRELKDKAYAGLSEPYAAGDTEAAVDAVKVGDNVNIELAQHIYRSLRQQDAGKADAFAASIDISSTGQELDVAPMEHLPPMPGDTKLDDLQKLKAELLERVSNNGPDALKSYLDIANRHSNPTHKNESLAAYVLAASELAQQAA